MPVLVDMQYKRAQQDVNSGNLFQLLACRQHDDVGLWILWPKFTELN